MPQPGLRALAPLADLHTFAQWVREREQHGFDAAYPYAYFVTDVLIERHGYAQVLEYFRRHRSGGDASAYFQAAFGKSVPQFQQVLYRRMAELLK